MPSHAQLPTIGTFVEAYGKAIRGTRAPLANVRTGSGYDLLGGTSAVLWSRQVQHDRELFRQIYRDTASRERLDEIVEASYQVERVRSTFGIGKAVFKRPAPASDGTIYAGTRIEVVRGAGSQPAVYVVTEDTAILASATEEAVPIRANRAGPGVAINTSANIRLGDSVFDADFAVVSVVCSDGTIEELDKDYVARASTDRRARRVGHDARIERACREAGADQVVILDAGVFGDDEDYGITHIYVGDAGYSTPDGLITACVLALESVRVLGCDVQVLPMASASVSLTAVVTLWDNPGKFDTIDIAIGAVAALVDEFAGRRDWWLFRLDALAGAIGRSSDAVQSVLLTSDPTEPAAEFVPVLTRYVMQPNAIDLTFAAPA